MSSTDGVACPVCGGSSAWLDAVDFNKSCEEINGVFLPPSGALVQYAVCEVCGFCFAPAMHQWSPGRFKAEVYNEAYEDVDPEYMGVRAINNAGFVSKLIPNARDLIRHLDYGGGDGFFSQLLSDSGWPASSHWDPYSDNCLTLPQPGSQNFITAFEVFEHVSDVHGLMRELSTLLARPGVILFSTLLSDGHIQCGKRLEWWYAAPRNGHISLFSKMSLEHLASQYGFHFGSFSPGMHVMCRGVPDWARHIVSLG
jgi:hypothetical protein